MVGFFLARSTFDLDYTGKQNTAIAFADVKDVHRRNWSKT
jgi:hypothetical protein